MATSRLLLVDDDEVIRLTLGRALERAASQSPVRQTW
jgi:ActR/RegA family two-component response regulator